MESVAICSYRNGSETRYGKGNVDDSNLISWTLACLRFRSERVNGRANVGC